MKHTLTFTVIKGPCFEWKGVTSDGYGQKCIKGKMQYTHRLAYAWVNGPIPPGMCILHHCDNPPCCNPDHLFLGTHQDNADDMKRKGRQKGSKQTHCKNGHPLSGANLSNRSRPGRRCKMCHKLYTRKYRKKQRNAS